MKNKKWRNTHSRMTSFTEVFFSNPSAIRMAPASPISPFPADQRTHNNNTINIPSSVNIFNKIILDHDKSGSYAQRILTHKVNVHKRFILLQKFSYSLGTSHPNSTAYHSFHIDDINVIQSKFILHIKQDALRR
jgi:hypothetical protein